MYHVFSSVCLKINRYSHDRQGKRRENLPTVCRWLVLQQLDIDSCQVTCGYQQVWLDLGISEGANIQFLQQPDSPRVYTEDAPVTLWCPLTDGTPCRCSWHLPFGDTSEREVLPGLWTLDHTAQHEAGWAFPPSPMPCICPAFQCLKCDPHWKPTALLLVGRQVLSAFYGQEPEDWTPTWSSQGQYLTVTEEATHRGSVPQPEHLTLQRNVPPPSVLRKGGKRRSCC